MCLFSVYKVTYFAVDQIEELIKMTPQVATRIRNGTEEKISVENVQVGDILKVLPGENIPTDGIIIHGETSIDQSTLTGESIPVDKKENDEVYFVDLPGYGYAKVSKAFPSLSPSFTA